MEYPEITFVDYIIPKADINITPTQINGSESIDDEFNEIISELNNHKNYFNDKSPDMTFKSMKICDIFFNLKAFVSEKYNMQVSTNATLKIYEILHVFHRQIFKSKQLNVFCNAELPGAMLVTLNHYCVTHKIKFDWLASSYVSSDDPTLLGDNYGIYKSNPDKWLMKLGEMDGNLTNPDVLIKIEKMVKARFPDGVDLYTSDAGIDVSNDYDTQEEQTLMINFGQILSGLMVLNKGGCLITKQYTFSTKFNRSLIAILTTLFDKLHIIKPKTSRPANSEIYIVGVGFQSLDRETLTPYLLSRLSYNYDYTKKTDKLCSYDEETDRLLLEATTEIHMNRQIKFLQISKNYYSALIGNKQLAQSYQKKYMEKCSDEIMKWIKDCNITKINPIHHM
jgi:hypothetical protein